MKYSEKTISAIEAATMDFGSRFLLNEAVVREVLEALESTDEQKALRADAEATCEWWNDGEMWESSCGVAYMFNSDGPEDNGHRFCHKCGNRIAIDEARGCS